MFPADLQARTPKHRWTVKDYPLAYSPLYLRPNCLNGLEKQPLTLLDPVFRKCTGSVWWNRAVLERFRKNLGVDDWQMSSK